jgi:hypothetical protein
MIELEMVFGMTHLKPPDGPQAEKEDTSQAKAK